MTDTQVQMSIPLSKLVPSRRNPRKIKPNRAAQRRLVALIRSQGLLQPLVVRRLKGKKFEVVAGERRLRALREIHKGKSDPKIPCVLHDVDPATADAMSLAENFGREAMHPLDEAEAFAKLATSDGQDADAIAAEFGVPVRYVRQRIKLASLAAPVKAAHRDGQIDTATAEAFAAVPEHRQIEVWRALNGKPRHAEQVRSVIANAWIDAAHALFEITTVPESAVSRDLFGDRMLIERTAFLDAQVAALEAQRHALIEDGWKEVVVGQREDVQDRIYAMDSPEREFDPQTRRKLDQIAARYEQLEAAAQKIDDGDEVQLSQMQERFDALESKEHEIIEQAPERFSEATKAVATIFLILDPDGCVHRDVRIPRRRHPQGTAGRNGQAGAGDNSEPPSPPTSDALSDRQCAVTFTHQAVAVREALLKNASARKRVLALMLHDKVRSEAIAVRRDVNPTTVHASTEGFTSAAFERLQGQRAKLDPFVKAHGVDECRGFKQLEKVSSSKLDALIDLLIVECITAHLQRPTELVHHLATLLKVDVRDHWRPDAAWLSSFQKIQLAHLAVELQGSAHAPAPETKKSELVELLATLFADAANGSLEDKRLMARVNAWLPSNLRNGKQHTTKPKRR